MGKIGKVYEDPEHPNNPDFYKRESYYIIFDVNTLDSIDYFSNKFDFELSETNQYIAFNNGESYNGVEIYDFATKQLLRRLPVNGPSLTGIEFSPDDKYIVTSNGPGQNSLIVWNVETGAKFYEYVTAGYSNIDVSHSTFKVITTIGRHMYLFHEHFGQTTVPNNEDGNYPLIYPNPAGDYIDINTNVVILNGTQWSEESNSLLVYDVLGNVVVDTPPDPLLIEGERIRIDVSGLAAGVYFVRVGGKVYKFVKM